MGGSRCFLRKMERKLKWKIGHLGTVDELFHIDLLHFYFFFSFFFPLDVASLFSFDLQRRLCTRIVLIYIYIYFFFFFFFFLLLLSFIYLFFFRCDFFFSRHDFYFLKNLGDFFFVVYHFFGFNWPSFF